MTPSDALDVCETALEWARERDYAGWDPYDGLNSPLLSLLCTNWFTRLVGMHGVHKSPINLRPILGVPKERNPKGIALFASSYLDLYRVTGKGWYLAEAERLLGWLEANQSTSFEKPCWGYNFDWQNARKFFLPAYEPSVVASVFCARAFLSHYRLTGSGRSLGMASGVCEFITEELNRVPVRDHEPYSYTPFDSYVVINANALAAGLLARVGEEADDSGFLSRADELTDFVVDVQDGKGAWYYSEPPEGSHLKHDNFHTGFVLESLRDCLGVRPRGEVESAYERGMEFYRRELFDPDGAPRFQHDKRYPRDVHGSAQAIRTLAKDGGDGSLSLAEDVIEWTLENLLDEEGYFYRRKGRILDDRTPYMRWNQAWMCFGLAAYLREHPDAPRGRDGAPEAHTVDG